MAKKVVEVLLLAYLGGEASPDLYSQVGLWTSAESVTLIKKVYIDYNTYMVVLDLHYTL